MINNSKPVFLNLYTSTFMPHYNTSKFLNAPIILNITYVKEYQHFKQNYDFLWSPWKNYDFLWSLSKKSFFGQNSFNINISFKERFLWSIKINRYLAITRLLSTFQWKLRYFGITLKKSFIGQNVEEYQHFKENYDFLWTLSKKSFFGQNSLNINISFEERFLWSIRINRYLAIIRLLSTFQWKLRYFGITLKKSFIDIY